MSLVKILYFANPLYKSIDIKSGCSNLVDEKWIYEYKLGDDFQLRVMFIHGIPGGELSTINEFCISLLFDRFHTTNSQVISDLRSSC